MQRMCLVCAAYVQRMCSVCAVYVQCMCSVCAAYMQRMWSYVSNLPFQIERLTSLCSQSKVPRDVAEAGLFLEEHKEVKVQLGTCY